MATTFTLKEKSFHIPECHILVIIKSWSPTYITLNVCDIIIDYVYILPQILFGLARTISFYRHLDDANDLSASSGNTAVFAQKYNLIQPISSIKGFFGALYLCNKKTSSNTSLFVTKIMDHQTILSPLIRTTQRHSLQSQLLENLNDIKSSSQHANVLAINAIFRGATNTMLVAPHCNGGNLYQRMLHNQQHNRQWTEYHISSIIRQVVSALHHMHATLGLIHGQLTPTKILFSNAHNLEVKVAGFGAGKLLSAFKNTAHFAKNIYYKSPEIITSQKYSHSSDMFAVGIITFLLVFGYHPFHPDDGYHHIAQSETKLVAEKIRKGFIVKIRRSSKYGKGAWFPDDIASSDDAKNFIAQLLQHKVRRRWAAAKALLHPFIANPQHLKEHTISTAVAESVCSIYRHTMYKECMLEVLRQQCHQNMHAGVEFIADLQKAWPHSNRGDDQMLDFRQLIALMQSSGITLEQSQIKQELAGMGVGWNRYKIAFVELLQFLGEECKTQNRQYLQRVLSTYDHYKNGYASVYQIKRVFQKYDRFGNSQCVNQLLEKQQVNRCGMINYEDLLMDLFPDEKHTACAKKKSTVEKAGSSLKTKPLPNLSILANRHFAR